MLELSLLIFTSGLLIIFQSKYNNHFIVRNKHLFLFMQYLNRVARLTTIASLPCGPPENKHIYIIYKTHYHIYESACRIKYVLDHIKHRLTFLLRS